MHEAQWAVHHHCSVLPWPQRSAQCCKGSNQLRHERLKTKGISVQRSAAGSSPRRMILPDRVLGSAGAQWMTSGVAMGPMALRTCAQGRASGFDCSAVELWSILVSWGVGIG